MAFRGIVSFFYVIHLRLPIILHCDVYFYWCWLPLGAHSALVVAGGQEEAGKQLISEQPERNKKG